MMGVKIAYEDKPLEKFHGEAKETEWEPAVDVVLLERVKSTGCEEHGFVSNDVERICGHKAESYLQYLENRGPMTAKELEFLKP